jgi:hypothetical protein
MSSLAAAGMILRRYVHYPRIATGEHYKDMTILGKDEG